MVHFAGGCATQQCFDCPMKESACSDKYTKTIQHLARQVYVGGGKVCKDGEDINSNIFLLHPCKYLLG